MKKSLDLGCGKEPKNRFNAEVIIGIDLRDRNEENIFKADLVIQPIPFPDNHFDYVTAYDFIEHIPRVLYTPQRTHPFVELMNEIYRVLNCDNGDGIFYSKTPCFSFAAAWRDPTHVNIITEETFPLYFDNHNRWASMYGFKGAFEIIEQKIEGIHLETVLKKVPKAKISNQTIYD